MSHSISKDTPLPTHSDVEDQITNIFITIDNYGTAEEARADIRQLVKTSQKLLLERLLEQMPEKHFCAKTCTDHSENWRSHHASWLIGYNTTISDVTEAIKQMMEELK